MFGSSAATAAAAAATLSNDSEFEFESGIDITDCVLVQIVLCGGKTCISSSFEHS